MQNYVIAMDGGQVVAVSELTREELSRGTASEVILKAIQTAGPSGRIALHSGVYELEQPVALPSGFTLTGSGRGTRLKAAKGFSGEALILATKADQITVENLALSPMETDGAAVGLLLHGCGDATLHNRPRPRTGPAQRA